MNIDEKIRIAEEIGEAFERLSNQKDSPLYKLPEDVLGAMAKAATEIADIYILGKKHGEEE